MAVNAKPLSARAREILTDAVITGTDLKLADQLSGADYKDIDAVLNALGGLWNRYRRVHEFPADPTNAIAQVLASGRLPLSDVASDGFVQTPEHLATELVGDYTELPFWGAQSPTKPVRVLEPSAGKGRLVIAVLDEHPDVEVWAVEAHPGRAQACAAAVRELHPDVTVIECDLDDLPDHTVHRPATVTVITATFEDFTRRITRAGTTALRFDIAVLNPPFSQPGQPTIWIDHVFYAWQLLDTGGHLAAIVPGSYTWRTDGRHPALRTLADTHSGIADPHPDDSFAAEGAGHPTMALRIDRDPGSNYCTTAKPQVTATPHTVTVTMEHTRKSISTQLTEASAHLGLTYTTTAEGGSLQYVIGGIAYTPRAAADYFLDGGFAAAYGRGHTIVHPDRLTDPAPARAIANTGQDRVALAG